MEDYSYLGSIEMPKRRKRLCSWCLKELNLVLEKSSKGTYKITNGICKRHFIEQMENLGLTSEVIDNKMDEMIRNLGEKAFCKDFDTVF